MGENRKEMLRKKKKKKRKIGETRNENSTIPMLKARRTTGYDEAAMYMTLLPRTKASPYDRFF